MVSKFFSTITFYFIFVSFCIVIVCYDYVYNTTYEEKNFSKPYQTQHVNQFMITRFVKYFVKRSAFLCSASMGVITIKPFSCASRIASILISMFSVGIMDRIFGNSNCRFIVTEQWFVKKIHCIVHHLMLNSKYWVTAT